MILGPTDAGHLQVRLDGTFIQAGDAVLLEPSLPGFFRELDSLWKGWDGERQWTSLGDGCVITARRDAAGRVDLAFSLHEPGMDGERVREAWKASLHVRVDVADLPEVARRLSDLLT